jgi:hypothetical protein
MYHPTIANDPKRTLATVSLSDLQNSNKTSSQIMYFDHIARSHDEVLHLA